jgi:lysophospholipase L1-like esterase
MSKWDVSEANNDWDNQEIVNAGGDHGNVWRSWVNIGEWMSLETYVNLSNTYDDLWIRADYYVDPNFNHIGQGGGYSGKMFPGFYSGDENAHADPMDTTTLGGRGGWFHLVWGSAGNPFLYRRDQIYNYLGYGEGGSLTPPKGYWSTVYVHVKNNTLGYTNGYVEAYQDGELKAKMTGTRTRSTDQGADYGQFERAIFSFFFGGEHTSVYASPRTQYIQMDNIAVYRFKPGANNYNASVKNIGASCPEVPALTASVTPEHLLKNETYINPSDTIYDVGNDKSNIYWPPYGKTPIYKKVVRPAGTTITYSFVTEEFGYPDYGIPCEMYVKVYADTGANKGTALSTFGRTGVNNGRDPGYTNPSGTYTISSNRATFEMYPGCNGGITRGVAIKYDSKPSLLFVGNSTMVPIYNLFVSENAPYINNNIAVSGHYISQQLAAWNALTTAQKQSYDYVLLQIGLNDCVANDSTTTATAYQNLVNQINTDKKATCKIIAATLTPAKGSSVDDDKWLAINRAIRGQGANAVEGIDIVMETNTTGLDGNSDMVMDAQYDSGDHIHPNATGQAVIKSNWLDVLP